MKRFGLFLLISIIFLVVACSNDNKSKDESKKDDADTKSVQKTVKIENKYKLIKKDRQGSDAEDVQNTVEVPVNPKNVVVFDYGAADTIKEFGKEDAIKGLPKGKNNSMLPDFLKDFKNEKYVNTGSLIEADFDKVAQLKPEVIFISSRTANQKALDEFKKAAPKAKIVYVGVDGKNYINSMKENTEKIGKIFNKEVKAKSLNEKLDKKVADMKAKTKKFNKTLLYLLYNDRELSAYGTKDYFGILVYSELGFKPVDKTIDGGPSGQIVSNEYLNEKNPDVILLMDRGQLMTGKSSDKQLLKNDVIKNVKAIKDNKVYELDPKLWFYASGSTATTIREIDELEKVVK